jgi:hypothetical protein
MSIRKRAVCALFALATVLMVTFFVGYAHSQSIRLQGPEPPVIEGDIIEISMYVTPPAWADTLQGVHVRVLDYDHSMLTFAGHTSYYPLEWNNPLGSVNSGCGNPNELLNSPYVHVGGHDGFGGSGGTVTIVVGGCAVEMPSDWDPWDTGGEEKLVATVRFLTTATGQTSVKFAECSNPQYRNYLTWIEWNSDCNTHEWQSDIVGANLENDPPTITTNGVVVFDIDTPTAVSVEGQTWEAVKGLYR